MNPEAAKIIAGLRLAALPDEGGFFRQTWTSPAQTVSGRGAASAIYFLLTPDDFSALHRLENDEVWFFHSGDSVEQVQLVPGRAQPQITILGPAVLSGHAPQIVVPGGVWQGARLQPESSEVSREGVPPTGQSSPVSRGWALLGCVVAPAWDQCEFLLGNRPELLREFPAAKSWIEALTR